MLPPWVEEDLLQDEAPDYREMNDPWGHADLIYNHIGDAIVMLWERLSVINFFDRHDLYDPADYRLLVDECITLSNWLLAVSGTVDSSGQSWVPLNAENTEVLNEIGGISFFNDEEINLSFDYLSRVMTRINRSATHGFQMMPGTRRVALRHAAEIVANAFADEQVIDDGSIRYTIHPPGSEKRMWPLAQVNKAKELYREGLVQEAGEECFKLLSGRISLYFQHDDDEYSRTLTGRQRRRVALVPGVVASSVYARDWLASEMEMMDAPMIAASLRMPMSDDDWESLRAVDILNEALGYDAPGWYITWHDGDLMLIPPDEDEEYYDD